MLLTCKRRNVSWLVTKRKSKVRRTFRTTASTELAHNCMTRTAIRAPESTRPRPRAFPALLDSIHHHLPLLARASPCSIFFILLLHGSLTPSSNAQRIITRQRLRMLLICITAAIASGCSQGGGSSSTPPTSPPLAPHYQEAREIRADFDAAFAKYAALERPQP